MPFHFMKIHSCQEAINNVSFINITFPSDTGFTVTPVITVNSLDSEANNSANVNVFIKNVTTLGFTAEFSQKFTGKITYTAITREI